MENRRPQSGIAPRANLRLKAALLARLQTVQLLRMTEREIAEMVKEVESDPVFGKLLYPENRAFKVVRFQPHPRTQLSPSFYAMNEETTAETARPEAAAVLLNGRGAMALIRRMGQEKFEKYFLRADQEVDRAQLAREVALSEQEIQQVRDFLLTYSVQSEFFDPPARAAASPGKRVVRLAHLSMDEKGNPVFEFGSPLLARGRYDIHYERLQSILMSAELSPGARRHMKAFVRRLELINWRQNTLYRILDLVCHTQRLYLATQDSLKKVPITQRQLAKRLAVAPSTINRAIQGRSLVLPWGEEVLLEDIFCSRKELCLDALGVMSEEDEDFDRRTDQELQDGLKTRLGLPVPRRTMNSYRRALAAPPPPASRPAPPSPAPK
jgi:hypothetical protein